MKRYITIYDRFTVKNTIIQLANRVYNLIEERGAENCVFLTVLEGGAFLSYKILNKLGVGMLTDLTVASLKVSSYKGRSRGELVYDYLPNIDCKEKTVILIDDICDSGVTVNELTRLYKNRFEAKDVIFVTLLERDSRQLDPEVNLISGVKTNSKDFFTGCGMDDNGKSRFLDSVIVEIDTDE